MQIHIVDDGRAAANFAAQLIVDAHNNGGRTFGLATGQTMVPVYEALVNQVRHAQIAADTWETFNLDEYVGIPSRHPGSFRYFMEEHLFGPLNLPRERTHLLDGMAEDLQAECARYEEALERADLDLQILGIGINGHIGFNEPGTPWDSRTHVIRLTQETLEQNGPGFPGKIPEEALTMGIQSILRACAIVVVAIGEKKAEAVRRAITGLPDVQCPASSLQTHGHVQYVIDQKAATLLLDDPEIQAHEVIQHA